ncbi:MAG: glycerophosphodiester phosphodiesterase [Pseudomonadales bacterium]|jgi:glycerophosphoryl diester phosphodiesterase|uniref:glycerophosphodiester phosphodiesterase family protein n=1 Tax=unclassified Ketobacter TaxID=2639109 RepID=UPI000C683B9F|nr:MULTISPECIES: glycerophosphodiester phosphodiesterase family protein [unclassified Ketobacter]MAQ25610.1 glycerophosphodiester phosphodiesterase [Pseudomonadales bacterium]MEC8809723.1 glycerophosphodiester phosphodiesterase family protein [Pseudomonadota bacterium]TNC90620.1 MAG: glycerophosphodiester phosphodiesterase [Alcanivorax sp.]HAG93749.1 glycerophosphodiester phosphodiesterase [Gammaproteobacteria bacterium]MBI25688.1 glycerophosphodiester phosphodiesterase [Pseudomonadales bacter|tara:strand:- start:49904 stop:51211 length:1308 start_codon:yes stop_codon:yes gene_type:complete
MKKQLIAVGLILSALLSGAAFAGNGTGKETGRAAHHKHPAQQGKPHWLFNYIKGGAVQLGPRPFYLLEELDDSALKQALKQCEKGPFFKTDFSIGHRGAALQFPEHTRESYQAAATQGAGIIECDVTFTKDKQLVCRHSQCDLHTTTNILDIPELAAKCSVPFTPADPLSGTPAQASCCTSDITLAEFKSLCGKMDAFNPAATTAQEYMQGTADWRTDLYATCGTLLTHAQSIELIKELGAKFTPELKSPSVEMPFEGDYSQQDYAQQMIDEYKAAGIAPHQVWPQSFDLDDVKFWIEQNPAFGRQAVFLDARMYESNDFSPTLASMEALKNQGVNIVAPPMWALLTLDNNGNLIPSEYAINARAAGLDIITWTLERDGPLSGGGGWYHQSIRDAINNDGDTLRVLHVLAQDVGVIGVFSDWPATTTYYANCMGL